jgi:hypothetical protein
VAQPSTGDFPTNCGGGVGDVAGAPPRGAAASSQHWTFSRKGPWVQNYLYLDLASRY